MKNFIKLLNKGVIKLDFRFKKYYSLEEILKEPKYKVYVSDNGRCHLIILKTPVGYSAQMVVERSLRKPKLYYISLKKLDLEEDLKNSKFTPYI